MLQIVFMLTWGNSLLELYKQIKQSDRILPNKRVFILHGLLLILYLTLDVLIMIASNVVKANECSYYCSLYCISTCKTSSQYDWLTFLDYATVLTTLFEVSTFFLAVSLMLPVTKSAIQKRTEFTELLKN